MSSNLESGIWLLYRKVTVVLGVGVTGGAAPGRFGHITGLLQELLEDRWRGGTQEVALLRSKFNTKFPPLTPGLTPHRPARPTPPREARGLRSSATDPGGASGGTWGAGAPRSRWAAPVQGRQSRDRAPPCPSVLWAGDDSAGSAPTSGAPPGEAKGASVRARSGRYLASRPAADARAQGNATC